MVRWLPLAAILLSACAGAQLSRQKTQIDALSAQAASLRAEVKAKDAALDSAKAWRADADARLAELEGKLAIASSQVDGLTKSNRQLSDAIGASQNDLGGKLDEAVSQKDEAAAKLADLGKQKLAQERLKNIYRSARDKAVAEVAKLQGERDSLLARQTQETERHAAAVAQTHDEMGSVADAILKEMQAGQVSAAVDADRFSVTLVDSLLFDEGSAKVRDDGAAFLERLGKALKNLGPREISIVTHTDNAPAKKGILGGFEDNWALSAARAASVARWLHEHAGLDPARLSAQGDGEFRPLKANDSPAARAENRRVVIAVKRIGPP